MEIIRITRTIIMNGLSLIILMLVLNIITIDEVLTIVGLDLKSNEAQALKLVIKRIKYIAKPVKSINKITKSK